MYRAPVEDIAFTLKHVAGMKSALDAGRFGDLGEDLVDAVLSEAGRFATEEVAPLYKIGDEHGAVLKDAAVTTPFGIKSKDNVCTFATRDSLETSLLMLAHSGRKPDFAWRIK